MLLQIGGLFIHLVLIVFRIVTSIKSPEALAINAVEVLRLFDVFVLTHDDDIWFDEALLEARRLSEKSGDDSRMILRQHGGNRIPLGRELKDGEVVIVLAHAALIRV